MITAIKGKISSISGMSITLETNGLSYEILTPASVLQRAKENQDSDGNIRLITYHYYQTVSYTHLLDPVVLTDTRSCSKFFLPIKYKLC